MHQWRCELPLPAVFSKLDGLTQFPAPLLPAPRFFPGLRDAFLTGTPAYGKEMLAGQNQLLAELRESLAEPT
jgi:hypothetical protein